MERLRQGLILLILLYFARGAFADERPLSPYLSCQTNSKITASEIARGYQPRTATEWQSGLEVPVYTFTASEDATDAKLLTDQVSAQLLETLAQNHTALQLIKDKCLSKMANWTDDLPKGCPALTRRLLYQDLPTVVRVNRMALGFSWKTSNTQSWRLWDVDQQMNPRLLAPPMGPVSGRWEPWTDRERALAQDVLVKYWDGPSTSDLEALAAQKTPMAIHYLFTVADPFSSKGDLSKATQTCTEIEKADFRSLGVIDHYLKTLACKISRLEKSSPVGSQRTQLDQAKDTFEKLQMSRRHADPVKRIEAAMLISDSNWQAYRESQLAQFRLRNQFVLWAAAETLRPSVYVTQARPTPAQISEALSSVQANNAKVAEEIRKMQSEIALDPSDATSEIFALLSYHQVVASTVADHPDLCSIATRLFYAKENREMWTAAAASLVMIAPFALLNPTLAAAAGPIASKIIVGTAAGLAVYYTTQEVFEAKHKQTQFMSLLARQPFSASPFPEAEDVMSAKMTSTMMAVIVGSAFGLPMLNFSRTAKLLRLLAH